MPFVTTELFDMIAMNLADDVDAVVPVAADGISQPLCTLYRVAVCLTEVDDALAKGRRSMQRLLDRVRSSRISFDDMSQLKGSHRFFDNLNTPADLAYAVTTFRGSENQNAAESK
jgi:molybdopterin-guanine dinucleotide biosynthesis protein A